jgi:hypothetical protein
MRMFLDQGSWMPNSQVLRSRAHAVGGLNRAATWYSLLPVIASAFFSVEGRDS